MTEFITRDVDGRPELVLSGEVDLATVDDLMVAAHSCLAAASEPVLVLNLAQVSFIDSSGLGALVRIRKAANDQGKDVLLEEVPASVSRLLEITGLTGVFATVVDG